ncbi:deoxynucleoside kinase [Truepera radiovictrix]|uniref:Deoxynucleoside kinase n=1 Tax=Truepera radiovictrix (strain DSM 17093 / CIP 108686 / LMG 22925 / RQ-24) TaxID=649638 RepID=D7CVL7_TRURR|nr:deoxynucleoside kinase [Truepera radiovictrix]ADI15928.1 deoxynucleoside kinase [Truepera radiovictrix DSM 17093]WMT58445.1 deoxynucleoside kinase [Truepera radiovictrix]
MFVAVAGNIGAGKSSLTRLLAEHYALAPIYEAVDENPYLEDFYRDMRRYAFHSQMFFLAKRLEQHARHVNPGDRVIQDRTIYEDAAVFAQNLFEEGVLGARDFGVYRAMYEAATQVLRPPDLLIYLRAELPTLRRHIALRGRRFELGIEDAYLERLSALYERWFASYTLSPKVVLEVGALDFVHRERDLQAVLARLAPWLAEPVLPLTAR